MSTAAAAPPGVRDRAWVEVSARALRANFRRVRESVGEGVGILPMIKADAYGLGMEETIRALEPLEPWGFGVATVEEGLRVRAAGVNRPVVVLSPLPPSSYRPAVAAGLSITVSDVGALERAERAARDEGAAAAFHLEIDTGMGRAGFDWRRAAEWAEAVRGRIGPHLRWEGVYTHFHSADRAAGGALEEQWERFRSALAALPFRPPETRVHACNSAAALRQPAFAADLVRPGIFLYGGAAGEGLPAPEPVAALRARIVFLKEAHAGATAGYGATYVATGDELWATAAVGYGDGIPRLLSNRGEALVHGRRVPIIGRISMDTTVLDVSAVPGVTVGDTATFVGSDGGEAISLEEVAGHARTISYEVLTGLTPRVPRTWMHDDGY